MILAKFYYTNTLTLTKRFDTMEELEWFAYCEGDHLLKYEVLN